MTSEPTNLDEVRRTEVTQLLHHMRALQQKELKQDSTMRCH